MTAKKMKYEEILTERYLKSIGFKNVNFEPDGNVTPDFKIDGNIAVEVRRLNQQYYAENKIKGLEEARKPLLKLAEACLTEFNNQYNGNSYWVSIKFHRPIPDGRITKNKMYKSLRYFLDNPLPLPCDIKVTNNISINISPSDPKEGRVFRLSYAIDRDSGGFLLAEFKKAFDYCVNDKSEKIKDKYILYDAWWLVLVDNIAYGFDENDKTELNKLLDVNCMWNKVIVLDSQSGNNILEINCN